MLKKIALIMVYLTVAVLVTQCHKSSNDTSSPTTPSTDGQNQDATNPNPFPGWTLVLEDSLKDGTTKAAFRGGEGYFRPGEGYYISGEYQSYLRYDPGVTGAIIVEFDAQGYISWESMHDGNDEMTIAIIQDAPPGTNWANWRVLPYFLFQTRKLANYSGGNATDGVKMKCGAANRTSYDGEWKTYMGQGLVGHSLSWDTSRTYHWTIILEPGWIELRRDEQAIFKDTLDGAIFGPAVDPIYVYIGGGEGFDYSPDNVTYSNVKIYRKN